MKTILIILGCILFTVNANAIYVVNDSTDNNTTIVDCTIEKKTLDFDNFKYDGSNLFNDIRMWYSLGFEPYKKWKSEADPERKKSYSNSAIDYFWKISISDPDAKFSRNTKSGQEFYAELSFEKLAEIYVDQNDLDMLEQVLARALIRFNKNTTLLRYAASYFKNKEKLLCAIESLKSWASLIESDSNNDQAREQIYITIMRYYAELNIVDKSIEYGNLALKINSANSDVQNFMAQLIGDPSELLKMYKEQLSKNPKDFELMLKTAKAAIQVEEYNYAIDLYKKVLKNDPKNMDIKNQLIKAFYGNKNFKDVIANAKNNPDMDIQKMLVLSYIELGQFASAFNIAALVQKTNNEEAHYLKGLVFEETAKAAQSSGDYTKKDFEWRLIYRLAYIEYLMGGNKGQDRASKILPLCPTKSTMFLKGNRIKPQTGNFSSWISWISSYNKEVYAPEN